MSTAARPTPVSDLDLWSDAVLADPYPAYRELRDAGAAVHLRRHAVWVVARYADVRAVLADDMTFSSASGVGINDRMNGLQAGTVLASDDPQHAVLRAVLSEKLAPRALAKLRTQIAEQADSLVRDAVEQGTFDGVGDLAARLPVDVVADLIGLPVQGREVLLPGADAMFAGMGPMDERLEARVPEIMAHQRYIGEMTSREKLTPGSWGAAILDAVDEGRIAPDAAVPLMTAYLVAGMDTTVHSLGNYLRLLAADPGLWKLLKADPSQIGSGFEECLRLESPAQNFTRVTTRAVEMGGEPLPAGARVVVSFASANRDERHYPDPDHFDIRRRPLDHLAFGHAVHGCAGQGLARIEAQALISALLRRVDRLELAGEPVRHLNPTIRGLAKLPVSVVPAGGR
ncbi:cytochrome P450 [Amycolatopsis pithecellobii]|uniref:Cytochrome P450 n=1 Tax=Amycolatopsis pithecellobii TaxID=664692 RepID=A0A6N7YK40_9PSEU|nr:cytochrome P450 [Amycolatopsis pithecellobii]MTD53275.1 cytochrome P450 [Amycolatopsis pithecellobii]